MYPFNSWKLGIQVLAEFRYTNKNDTKVKSTVYDFVQLPNRIKKIKLHGWISLPFHLVIWLTIFWFVFMNHKVRTEKGEGG